MADPIQATKSEAISKILDGVLHPNTVYVWLENTQRAIEAAAEEVLTEFHTGGRPTVKYNRRERVMYFDNGSEILFRSANDVHHFCGFRTHGLVSTITDRKDLALAGALTCLTQTQGWLVFINDTRTNSERAVG